MPTLTTTTGFSASGNFLGAEPQPGFAADASGDLFGAASAGGQYSDGQIFEIAKSASGYAGTPGVAVSFNGLDGETPNGGLITDANGDLFGTTSAGGANSDGAVFDIAATPAGLAMTPTVLVSFNGTNGETPAGGLIADARGDLFGITRAGGANRDGVVFEIAKTASGYASTPTVLTSLATADGLSPNGTLAMDAASDLFATMGTGGPHGEGTLLEIADTPGGYAATPTVLVSFNGTDGGYPGAPSIDANGDLFGTTFGGGADDDGVIDELAHTTSGYASTPTVLTSFTHEDTFNRALLVDAAGDLFGTKSPNGGGIETIYELLNTPSGYAATPGTAVTFPSPLTFVEAPLTADASGDLFGVTLFGGSGNFGNVFELMNAPFEVAGTGSVAGLPDVSLDFIPSVARAIAARETALIGAGTPNEIVAGSGSPPAPVAGRLNALLVAGPNAAAATTLPSGYQEGILAAASASLADSIGGALLVATGASTTLMGAANDALYGGNFNTTLVAGGGAETLTSGIGANLLWLNGADVDVNANGADTIVGGNGAATINASGPALIFGKSSAINAVAGLGAATVVGGTGGTTLSGGASGTLYFANGQTTYTAGTGVDTLVGLGNAITATGGANGAVIFTGTAGGSSVAGGAGNATILGLGQGDVLTATGSGTQVFGATAGAETINATGASGNNDFFTFGQNDVVEPGSGTTYVENLAGNLTLIGGGGDLALDIAANGARAITVENFSAANDQVQISNSSPSAVNAELASASVTNGGETLTLSDGSLLTFQGVTGLTSQSVFAVTTFQYI